MEARRLATGCSDVEAWRYGGALQACRRGCMELWKRAIGVVTWRRGGSEEAWGSGAPEARCSRADVEVFASRTVEGRRRSVDAEA